MKDFFQSVFVMSLLWTGCQGLCTTNSIRSCLRSTGLASFLGQHDIDVADKHDRLESKKLTLAAEDLRSYCSLFEEYKTCLQRSVTPYCDELTASVYRGLFEGMRYFCHDSLDEFLTKHHTCMARLHVRQTMESCALRAEQQVSYYTTTQESCRILLEGEECEVKAVRDECGSATAQWYTILVKKYSKYLKPYQGCPNEDRANNDYTDTRKGGISHDSDSSSGSGGGVSEEDEASHLRFIFLPVGVLAVIGLLLVAVCCTIGCRRQKHAHVAPSRDIGESDNNAPPSYEHAVVIDDDVALIKNVK